MIEDTILKEVRAARDAYARLHDFDVRRIVAHLRELNSAGDWPVVSFATAPATRVPVSPGGRPRRGAENHSPVDSISVVDVTDASEPPSPSAPATTGTH